MSKSQNSYSSGAHGKAAIDRRVAEANVRVAGTISVRAVCTEALTGIREQSRLPVAERAALVGQQAAAVGSAEAAGQQLQSSAAQADGWHEKTEGESKEEGKQEGIA